MPERIILLDSNSYFRLAVSVHPLLEIKFGSEPCSLFVINELDEEYKRSSRLLNKFHWVSEAQYVKDRRNLVKCGSKQRSLIDNAYSYILAEAKRLDISISRVDARVLATAYILKISIVSDDGGIQELSGIYGIKIMSTLELMKLMMDNKRINLKMVKQIVAYWAYEKDLPSAKHQFIRDYKNFFGEEPPDENYVDDD